MHPVSYTHLEATVTVHQLAEDLAVTAPVDVAVMVFPAVSAAFVKSNEVGHTERPPRQPVSRRKGGYERLVLLDHALHAVVTARPVSYTHLDVYKRQPRRSTPHNRSHALRRPPDAGATSPPPRRTWP